jgi:hypothetical protein
MEMVHGAYKAGYQILHFRFKGYSYKSSVHFSIQKYCPNQNELVMNNSVKFADFKYQYKIKHTKF